MTRRRIKSIIETTSPASAPTSGVRVGRIVAIDDGGRPSVDFPGNPHGPLTARSALTSADLSASTDLMQADVLLLFENGDLQAPIIVGRVQANLPQPRSEPAPEMALDLPVAAEKAVNVDGERLVFEAKQEVVLRCGKASLTLRADGKVVLKGTDLLSRAARSNKIKGASINLN